MHAVILNSNLRNHDVVFTSNDLMQFQLVKKKVSYSKKQPKSYILCHVRKIDKHYNEGQANSKKRKASLKRNKHLNSEKVAKKLKFPA